MFLNSPESPIFITNMYFSKIGNGFGVMNNINVQLLLPRALEYAKWKSRSPCTHLSVDDLFFIAFQGPPLSDLNALCPRLAAKSQALSPRSNSVLYQEFEIGFPQSQIVPCRSIHTTWPMSAIKCSTWAGFNIP